MEIETSLKILLESDDSQDRIEAAEVIANSEFFGDEQIKIFATLLKDNDSGVKDFIARTLSEQKDKLAMLVSKYVVPYILETNKELRNLAGDILIRIGSPAAEFLTDFLQNEDADVRKFACDILGLLGTRHLNERIKPLLFDSDSNVVQSAVEALGNYQDSTSIPQLIDIFNSGYDQKPIIIEALGKIGTKEAMNYLLEFLDTEDDIFLKTTIIDSLSLNCDDIEIAGKLFESIEKESEQVRIIILKTVAAIAFRLGEDLVLPDHLRQIAYKAMFDEDPDIRAAGLLSLGNVYYQDDFPSIFNEIFKNNPDTQSLVLDRILYYNEPETIKKFFKGFCNEVSSRSSVSCDIDFLALISYMWNDVPKENKIATFEVMIENLFSCKSAEIDTTFELLLKLDKSSALLILKEFYSQASESSKQCIDDLLEKYELTF